MKKLWVCLLTLWLMAPLRADTEVTLELIMQDPSWIGAWPTQARFAADGESVFYTRHKPERGYDVVQLDLQGRTLKVWPVDSLPSWQDKGSGGLLSVWEGDLWLDGKRLTLTEARESSPLWHGAHRFSFQRYGRILLQDLKHHGLRQVVDFTEGEPPKEPEEFLPQQQDRLFEVLRQREAERRRQLEQGPVPRVYLGKDRKLVRAELSRDEATVIYVTGKKTKSGQADKMPEFVTRSGYVEVREVRSKVGTDEADEHLLLLWSEGKSLEVALNLPQQEERKLRVGDIKQSAGGQVAVMWFSHDHEHRWLTLLDRKQARLMVVEHLHDPAWHTWSKNEFGWAGETLWFQSEASGYAQLYARIEGQNRRLTRGDFVAEAVQVDPSGRFLYYTGNVDHPGDYDVYRVEIHSGKNERITRLGGLVEYHLAPDGNRLLVLHSGIDQPPELFLQSARPGAEARPLTQITSAAFRAIDWTVPEIVKIPSSHAQQPIYSKVYRSQTPVEGKRPAVVFVHGAGYLQNAHRGWSYYFREFMFHTLLTRRGYVVLDMDYRASAGYGRAWRSAIYRQMGTPELEDLQDGVDYLVAHENVDRQRIGVYGGSYGGFLTLMALFKEPDLFACGAALRPVTDWAHYNDGYTARILNTPEEDPEAYNRSSPIEFAEGLNRPLLMAHGMLDDNVFVEDTIRLAQRLIELKKENWEMALYPVEPHGFIEPTSWLDEYRRIFKLFEENLR